MKDCYSGGDTYKEFQLNFHFGSEGKGEKEAVETAEVMGVEDSKITKAVIETKNETKELSYVTR